jgi:hypothetical protein
MAGELKDKDKQSVLSDKDKFEHSDADTKMSQMGEKKSGKAKSSGTGETKNKK